MDKHYIIPIFVPHKGCPHDCVFCNQKKITGINKDITSNDVKDTIEKYLATINKNNHNAYVEVSFFGGSFTGIPIEHQRELLSEAKNAKQSGLISAIRLSTRPDYINAFILENLKEYSVDIIELGVQSMSEAVLTASERGHTSEDVKNAAALIKAYGFQLGLQMMTGLPLDTEERDLFTAEELIKLKPDFVRIYPSLIIRETYLEEMYYKGVYTPMSVDQAVEICKKLYRLFQNNNIQIIRLGLQPTDTITLGKDVVAGPFHPAFRELVESALMNEMAEFIIGKFFGEDEKIIIEVNPRDISKIFADKKRYFATLKSKFFTKKITVVQNCDIKNMSIHITTGLRNKKMSLYEYLKLEK